MFWYIIKVKIIFHLPRRLASIINESIELLEDVIKEYPIKEGHIRIINTRIREDWQQQGIPPLRAAKQKNIILYFCPLS